MACLRCRAQGQGHDLLPRTLLPVVNLLLDNQGYECRESLKPAASHSIHIPRELLDQRVVQNLGRMLQVRLSVFYLMPAARTRCGNDRVRRSRTHRWQEYEFADLH